MLYQFLAWSNFLAKLWGILRLMAVEVPGFPRRGGGRQLLNLDQKAIIWEDFWRKMHKNERNRTEGARVRGAPLPSPLDLVTMNFYVCLGKLLPVLFLTFQGSILQWSVTNSNAWRIHRGGTDNGKTGKKSQNFLHGTHISITFSLEMLLRKMDPSCAGVGDQSCIL